MLEVTTVFFYNKIISFIVSNIYRRRSYGVCSGEALRRFRRYKVVFAFTKNQKRKTINDALTFVNVLTQYLKRQRSSANHFYLISIISENRTSPNKKCMNKWRSSE